METLLLVLLLLLFGLLVPVGMIWAAGEFARLRDRISALEARLRGLEQMGIAGPERPFPSAADSASTSGVGAGVAPGTMDSVAALRTDARVVGPTESASLAAGPTLDGVVPRLERWAQVQQHSRSVPPRRAATVDTAKPPRRPGLGEWLPWRALERQLIENWTGLLGVLVLVAGLTFLVVNIALTLGPLARFVLTLAAAAALAAPSLRWSLHPRWGSLVAWLRSGGASLALFACVAAGSLPELGLRWLEDPRQALGLLLVGMAVNLAVAGLSRDQTIASLHVLVNLVPLLLAPQSRITLVVASLVCLAGLILAAKRPWDRHRLRVVLGYGLIQGVWLLRLGERMASQTALRWEGLGAALLVFGTGVLLLQRGDRRVEPPTPARLAALIAAWGGLGLALLAYPQQAALRAIGLVLTAALALLLARASRSGPGQPLRTLQTLISQSLVMAALLSLQPLVPDGLLLNLVLLGESGLFLLLVLRQQEPDRRLQTVGWSLVAFLALTLLLQAWALVALQTLAPWRQALVFPITIRGALPTESFRPAVLLFAAPALLVGLAWQQQRRGVVIPWSPLLSWQAAALVLLGASGLSPSDWRGCLTLLSMGGLLFADRRMRPPGLGQATALAIALAQLGTWGWLLVSRPGPDLVLMQLSPLLALAVVQVALGGSARRRALGLDLLGLNLGLGAELLLQPLSPALPPVAWLLLSLPALLAADRLRQPLNSHGLALGLVALGAYASGFVVEIATSSSRMAVLGLQLEPRPLIELLAVVVLAAWWRFQPRGPLASTWLWRRSHPWFLELLLLAVLVPLWTELSRLWQPFGLALFALVLLSQPASRWLAPRARLHGVLVYWLSIACGLVLPQTLPQADWQGWPALLAHQAVALQLLFALLAQRCLSEPRLRAMAALPLLGGLASALARHTHRWLWYPLFVALAVQLARGFDHALLTLVWALEAFLIYGLSAVLRDGQFRLVALLGLGACFLRLLVVDLAEADLGLRGLVFVGVGFLLLAMNALYKRFEERFR